MAAPSIGQQAQLTFTDDSAASPSSSDLETGFVSTICNTSASTQAVTPSLQGFHFTSINPTSTDPTTTTAAAKPAGEKEAQTTAKKQPVATNDVLTLSPTRFGTLAAGECRDVTVALKDPSPVLSDPTYSGVLLVNSSNGAFARRPVTIPGTAAEAKPVAAVNGLDLQGTFRFKDPRGGSIKLRDGAIALTYTGTEPPLIPKDTRVGVVAQGSDVAILRSTEDSHKARGNTIVIPVELKHASGHGTFKGTLDTAIAGTSDKPIALSVTVGDGWSLPIGILFLGLLIALGAKLAVGKWIPRARLKWRRDKLAEKYEDGGSSFKSDCAKFAARYRPPIATSIDEFKASSKRAAKRYSKTTLIFDSTSADLKKVLDDLAAAEKDASLFKDGDLCDALTKLESKLDCFAHYLAEHFPLSPPPALAKRATGILGPPESNPPAPRALPVGGATELVSKAQEAAALLTTWTGWADDLRRYQEWVSRLAVAMASTGPSGPFDMLAVQADQEELRRVASRLVQAHHEMLDADTKDGMEAVQAPADLKRAFRTLAMLGGRYGVWVPRNWDEKSADADVFEGLAAVAMFDVTLNPAALTAALMKSGWETDAITVELRETAEDVGAFVGFGLAMILEALVLFAAGGLALITGFRALYVNKPFGSWDDYLAVLALGIAAEALIGGVITALQAWRSPAGSTPAATAAAKT
jgi:hypothetical protein